MASVFCRKRISLVAILIFTALFACLVPFYDDECGEMYEDFCEKRTIIARTNLGLVTFFCLTGFLLFILGEISSKCTVCIPVIFLVTMYSSLKFPRASIVVFANILKILSCIWLLFQAFIVVELIYGAHNAILGHVNNGRVVVVRPRRAILHLATSVGLILCCGLVPQFLLPLFGTCPENISTIYFVLALFVFQFLCSMLPQFNKGFLIPTLTCVYSLSLTLAAFTSDPRPQCNPSANENESQLWQGSNKSIAQVMTASFFAMALASGVLGRSKVVTQFTSWLKSLDSNNNSSWLPCVVSERGGHSVPPLASKDRGRGRDRDWDAHSRSEATALLADMPKPDTAGVGASSAAAAGGEGGGGFNTHTSHGNAHPPSPGGSTGCEGKYEENGGPSGDGWDRLVLCLVLACASSYLSMVMTDWGDLSGAPEAQAPPFVGYSSRYVKIWGALCAAGVYVASLVHAQRLYGDYRKNVGQSFETVLVAATSV